MLGKRNTRVYLSKKEEQVIPTFEFFGYSHEDASSMIDLAKQLYADLPFKENIVFVIRPDEQSRVVGYDGSSCPFVRIFTRSKERARILQERIHPYTDVEIVFIDFYPRKVSEG